MDKETIMRTLCLVALALAMSIINKPAVSSAVGQTQVGVEKLARIRSARPMRRGSPIRNFPPPMVG